MRPNGVKALYGIAISIVSIVLLLSGNIETYWKVFVLGEICYVVFCVFAIKESVAELFFACLLTASVILPELAEAGYVYPAEIIWFCRVFLLFFAMMQLIISIDTLFREAKRTTEIKNAQMNLEEAEIEKYKKENSITALKYILIFFAYMGGFGLMHFGYKEGAYIIWALTFGMILREWISLIIFLKKKPVKTQQENVKASTGHSRYNNEKVDPKFRKETVYARRTEPKKEEQMYAYATFDGNRDSLHRKNNEQPRYYNPENNTGRSYRTNTSARNTETTYRKAYSRKTDSFRAESGAANNRTDKYAEKTGSTGYSFKKADITQDTNTTTDRKRSESIHADTPGNEYKEQVKTEPTYDSVEVQKMIYQRLAEQRVNSVCGWLKGFAAEGNIQVNDTLYLFMEVCLKELYKQAKKFDSNAFHTVSPQFIKSSENKEDNEITYQATISNAVLFDSFTGNVKNKLRGKGVETTILYSYPGIHSVSDRLIHTCINNELAADAETILKQVYQHNSEFYQQDKENQLSFKINEKADEEQIGMIVAASVRIKRPEEYKTTFENELYRLAIHQK